MELAKKQYKVSFPNQKITIEAELGDNLLSLMQIADIPIAANCGGIGKCGKCLVEINGKTAHACKTHIIEDCEVITLEEDNSDFEILTESAISFNEDATSESSKISPQNDNAINDNAINDNIKSDNAKSDNAKSDNAINDNTINDNAINKEYIIAIDIGTTTVVVKLLRLSDAREVASDAFLNPQIKYGTDVISRIKNSMDDAKLLSALIREKLDSSITNLLKKYSIKSSEINKIIIAGNTAMTYILLNIPCRSLGVAPFEPKYTIDIEYDYKTIFDKETLSCKCFVIPFLFAYVGGDITSGLLSLSNTSLSKTDGYILIDMGTNGELAYRTKEKLICTSTAAGPAFEGVNISCGMGSTEGAISKVWIENETFKYSTIGSAEPKGLCGSGILDLMACLVRESIIDETGALDEDSKYVESDGILIAINQENDNKIIFTQKDVREFQLAKSAVRSGIEILLNEMPDKSPTTVYLAGGFGQNLNPESAFDVGLLPVSLKGKVIPAGNTSLSGAIKVAFNPTLLNEAKKIAEGSEEIILATHPSFNNFFMDFIGFEN